MNEYFVEKIRNLKLKFGDIPVAFEHCHKAMLGKKCKLSMKFVTQKKVLKILKNLKKSRSLAIDELDSYSLKIAAEVIAPCVHHIVNYATKFSICMEVF